eukprot:CAMPEP_0183720050 /NCGR_PEP_ID=MMETSP0737-20130205/12780_1 /TAXON_ID=385413 /ORGANISM="Thalassiosira miniscula, Strain CCMP1093" /LENGTH=71 /DNA_ID=CAMNT_0025949857 /DNA_START=1104 /DNA_END=1315 /DNA_ORIENTATION=+
MDPISPSVNLDARLSSISAKSRISQFDDEMMALLADDDCPFHLSLCQDKWGAVIAAANNAREGLGRCVATS